MKPLAMLWLSVALSAACCSDAAAQGVLGSIIPSPASWFDSRIEYLEARPFGEDGKQLPGQRITRVTKLKGKWLHRQLRRNVELERVRVPQSSTSLLLDLQADGGYTVDYQVVWGGAANSPDSRFATLEVHEKGSFALSGSILLLEPTAIDVVRTGRNGEQRDSLQNQRRAYIARLDKNYLNIAVRAHRIRPKSSATAIAMSGLHCRLWQRNSRRSKHLRSLHPSLNRRPGPVVECEALMKSVVLIAFAALQLLCCALAAAQARNTTGSGIEDVIRFPGAGTLGGRGTPAREARAYGSDGAALPGKRIEAVADIVGKWRYQETRNNVEIKGVRVPVRTTNLTLELREDGTYTLGYEVYWGLGNGDPKGQQAGLIVKERGKYALSGSILLLEAEPLEVIEQGRFERTTRSVAADKRAYIARLETGVGLNIAGACAAYQIETPCAASRSVWIPLIRPERRSNLRTR